MVVFARRASGGWRSRHPGNEAGMCFGINDFTHCAPIADWVATDEVVGWLLIAARTYRKRRDVCATQVAGGHEARGTKPECALESMVSLIALLSRIGCPGIKGEL